MWACAFYTCLCYSYQEQPGINGLENPPREGGDLVQSAEKTRNGVRTLWALSPQTLCGVMTSLDGRYVVYYILCDSI